MGRSSISHRGVFSSAHLPNDSSPVSISLNSLTQEEIVFLANLLPEKTASLRKGPASLAPLMREENVSVAEGDRATFHRALHGDLNHCLDVFQRASTLKDDYSPTDAAAIYRLGQYLVMLRWPEIKAGLARAVARKKQVI